MKKTMMSAVLLALSSAIPVAAHADTIFGSNLVVNGNAEAGPGSANGGAVANIPGFTTSGNFTVVNWGASGGFPGLSDPGPGDRGLNFFAGGESNGSSQATQIINLGSGATAIDSGHTSFNLSAWLGGYASQNDNIKVDVRFLDGQSVQLGSTVLAPVLAGERGNVTGLLFHSSTGFVPVNTRSVAISLISTRTDGSYNDGYADNLSLVLTAPPVPEPATYGMVLAGLAGLSLVARRRKHTTLAK